MCNQKHRVISISVEIKNETCYCLAVEKTDNYFSALNELYSKVPYKFNRPVAASQLKASVSSP